MTCKAYLQAVTDTSGDSPAAPEATKPEVGTLQLVSADAPALMPGRNGGKLKRGNPGNTGGRPPSKVSADLLAAGTPEAARVLLKMGLEGVNPLKDKDGERNVPLTPQDRVKALTAVLDRGGVPARSEVTGADGMPFTVAILAQKAGD